MRQAGDRGRRHPGSHARPGWRSPRALVRESRTRRASRSRDASVGLPDATDRSPASAAGAGAALQRGPRPEPRAGTCGDTEPSAATDCAPRWRWPDSLTAEATEGPGTGPPARPATCRPRGDRARPAPGGSLSNRRAGWAGNDSSTSTRLPRLEPRNSFLAGEADSVPPLTGPRPPRPPENRKQEGRQPKKHRCAPHGSNAGVQLCTRSLPNCFLDTSAGGKYL